MNIKNKEVEFISKNETTADYTLWYYKDNKIMNRLLAKANCTRLWKRIILPFELHRIERIKSLNGDDKGIKKGIIK